MRKYFNNLTISKRLTVGFAAIIFFCILIGIYSVTNFQQISKETQTMYDGPYSKMKAVLTIKADIVKMQSLMQEISTLTDEAQISAVAEQTKLYESDVFEQFKIFERDFDGDEELLMDLKLAFIDWKPIREEIINLSLADMRDIAVRITNQEGNTQVNHLMKSIDPFVSYAEQATEQFVTDTRAVSNVSYIVNLLLIVITCVVSIFIAAVTARSIVRPLKTIQNAAQKMSEGDLSAVLSSPYHDEIGNLTNALSDTLVSFNGMIQDVSQSLHRMAQGDMAFTMTGDYQGDFLPIQSALNGILSSLNHMLIQIGHTTQAVAAGSSNVFTEAEKLTGSVKLEADRMSLLSDITKQVSLQSGQNAQRAQEASGLTDDVRIQAAAGNNKMFKMLHSMEKIEQSSADIHKMVNIMDNIAFQTTILSLNASIEAARAGVHGKGFAVVADEVRALAAKSIEAADQTRILADLSMENVVNGKEDAQGTANVLNHIVANMEEIAPLIGQISQDSTEQTNSIREVIAIVDEIKGLAEQNAQGALQSEAESRNMSQQAVILQELFTQFQLKDEEAYSI